MLRAFARNRTPVRSPRDQGGHAGGSSGEKSPRGSDPRFAGRGPVQPGCSRWLLWGFVAALIYLSLQQLLSPGTRGSPLAYSDFREQLESGNVTEVTVRGERIQGTLRESLQRVREGDTVHISQFETTLPAFGDDALLQLLLEEEVEVDAVPEADAGWLQLLLFGLLPVILLGALFLFTMRRSAGAAQSIFSMGRSGARQYEREKTATTFDDVAGAAGAKRELQEVVEFLKDPRRFHRLGAEVPKGVLLVGPPGTGKTLLARAVAGEADVSFFIITGSDFMEMFVGVGAKRVRDLFKQAKEAAPSIIFIDELDSIGRHRGAGLGGGHDEREQTLNQLLSELDGFEPAENVMVMAATNRPDILDPALLRPGRFDRRIAVDLPSAGERLEILRLHARGMPLAQEVDLGPVAQGTPGFSGADLKNLLNEGALAAARRGKGAIGSLDLEAARDRILMGLKREGLALTAEELELLAYHEAGHAVVGAALPNADPIHKVTIVPRGRSMGSTHQLPTRERYLWKREDLLDRIAMTLGGRAAEALVFDTATSGAEDDLEKATALARRMVLRWGMSEGLGVFAASAQQKNVFLGEEITRQRDHSEATARKADEEVRRILEASAERARNTLREHRDSLDEIAGLLLEKEEITGEEVMKRFEKAGKS